MKTLTLLFILFSGIQAFAGETCIQLSQDGKTWNQGDTICISKMTDGSTSEYRIDLNVGVGIKKKTIASYFLNSLPSGGDSKAFGPSDTEVTIFDNRVMISVGHDEVSIGGETFFVKTF